MRTGWGDNESYVTMGEDYELRSPYYSDESLKRLAELMVQNKSDLFGYDVANCYDYTELKRAWCAQTPRPQPWPSPEAKAFIAQQAARGHGPAYSSRMLGHIFGAGIAAIGGLTNCGAISCARVKLIALPLRIKGVTSAACHVIALED
ncbi:MAG: hypothetical protein HYU86_02400 [Chloroflexi bacterium]|nr:hypothetical protein [Chloroflexota bacterium]